MRWLEPVSNFDRSAEAREFDARWQQMHQPAGVRSRPLAEPHVPDPACFRMLPPDDGRDLHRNRDREPPKQKGRRSLSDAERAEIVETLTTTPRGRHTRGRGGIVYALADRYGVGVSTIYDVARQGAA
jgi:hypothetical protein